MFEIISLNLVFAYLDPGTGSYLFQLLIAFILGGIYAIKVFWAKIITFFKNIFGKSKSKKEDNE